jgi:aminopeptidase N
MGRIFLAACSLLAVISGRAQLLSNKQTFTKSDSLRGSLNAERNWWNVQHYAIEVKPDLTNKTITGKTTITALVDTRKNTPLQLDLQAPLVIDSIICNKQQVKFKKADTAVWYLYFSNLPPLKFSDNPRKDINLLPEIQFTVYYHGKPREAVNPPWDGGWIWKRDKYSRPWVSVAVQGLGASAWFPCKDHQSDEPDKGATLSVIIPDTLVAVANGKLISQSTNQQLTTYTWKVINPINNYCIIPYIGKYQHWNDTLNGEKGKLDLDYWVLDYNMDKARKQFEQVKPMLRCFEHWFGAYPFYEDGYKLVQSPHLGMEHQSAVAYGNGFMNGYMGRDLSGTGWGKQWDYIIIHESGHEWFANNITTNDVADMWVHEGFTMYSEVIYTEWLSGRKAADEYCFGIRGSIENDRPITGMYGVNKEGSGDMYYKGANMIHFIRNVMNNDEKFRQLLRGLNKDFYHQTVTAKQVEDYINRFTKINFNPLFNQYLNTTQIPVLEINISSNKQTARVRFTQCTKGFTVPMVLKSEKDSLTISPTEIWTTVQLKPGQDKLLDKKAIEQLYYLEVKAVE